MTQVLMGEFSQALPFWLLSPGWALESESGLREGPILPTAFLQAPLPRLGWVGRPQISPSIP